MLETRCPVCGQETLELCQNADIRYKVINGSRLVPVLDEDSIGWMDSVNMWCTNCMANDDDNDEIADIKHEYIDYL